MNPEALTPTEPEREEASRAAREGGSGQRALSMGQSMQFYKRGGVDSPGREITEDKN